MSTTPLLTEIEALRVRLAREEQAYRECFEESTRLRDKLASIEAELGPLNADRLALVSTVLQATRSWRESYDQVKSARDKLDDKNVDLTPIAGVFKLHDLAEAARTADKFLAVFDLERGAS